MTKSPYYQIFRKPGFNFSPWLHPFVAVGIWGKEGGLQIIAAPRGSNWIRSSSVLGRAKGFAAGAAGAAVAPATAATGGRELEGSAG